MAQLALDIAQVKPHRRKRYRYLKAKRPQLLARLHELFPGEVYDPATDGLYLDECDDMMEFGDAEPADSFDLDKDRQIAIESGGDAAQDWDWEFIPF